MSCYNQITEQCSCTDGPECDVIRIERYIRLIDDNADILRHMQNLHSLRFNMRYDPVSHGPIVPLLP